MPTSTTKPAPAPLGPDSLTWKLFGQLRGMLWVPRVGLIENMHPELGAGVAAHSDVFGNPLDRLVRSLGPIYGVVYDGPKAHETALAVRGYHKHIRGTDSHGRRYNALHPWTFYWAHATFFEGLISGAEFYGTPFTEAQKRQLYDEHVQWWALYGMPMDIVPPTWEEFQEYWKLMLTEVLEDTAAARGIIDFADLAQVLPGVPTWLARRLPLPAGGGVRLLTVGTLPPEAREILGLRWTRTDELAVRAIGEAARRTWPFVLHRFRYHPRALAGFRREAAASRASAGGREPIAA